MGRNSDKLLPARIGAAAAAIALSFSLLAGGNAAAFSAMGGNGASSSVSGGNAAASSVTSGDAAVPSGAGENAAAPSVTSGDATEIISVELPTVAEGEPSPFDFFLDPEGLLYETHAVRYGGGAVEEGATLLFHNQEGEYAFSRYSDKLSVINKSGEPVIVTISASVSDLEGISLAGNSDLSESEEPCLYLALRDDCGQEQAISQDAGAEIRMELDSGVYSFGLTGACSTGNGWQEVTVCPKVRVTWHIEPAPTEAQDEESHETGEERE